MKITHYLYNAYVIESGNRKIAIDPGGLFLYFFRMSTLIPQSEWSSITHLLVTHGDPDHYWHFGGVLDASGAEVICGRAMVEQIGGRKYLLGPRSRGLAFTLPVPNPHAIGVGESVEVDGVGFSGIKTVHGQLLIKIGPLAKIIKPGPKERLGWGAMGFNIELDGKKLINLGDTLLQARDWQSLSVPDVLMIPIGGRAIHNTMNEEEALQAVEIIKPRLVIPCHYNCPAFFTKRYNPADAQKFKTRVEGLGFECAILGSRDSIEI